MVYGWAGMARERMGRDGNGDGDGSIGSEYPHRSGFTPRAAQTSACGNLSARLACVLDANVGLEGSMESEGSSEALRYLQAVARGRPAEWRRRRPELQGCST